MVLAYTQVVAGASTNVTTPTTEQFNQGNNQLTPYNSAVNNGYYRQISQAVFNLNAEVINVIESAGLTPSASLSQLLAAINVLKVPPLATETQAGTAEIATQAETISGAASKIVDPAKLIGLFASSLRGSEGSINLPINISGNFSNIIVKFGVLSNVALNETFHAVNFATAFPTAIFNVQATISMTNSIEGSIAALVKKGAVNTSSIQICGDYSPNTGTGDIYWLAIGY